MTTKKACACPNPAIHLSLVAMDGRQEIDPLKCVLTSQEHEKADDVRFERISLNLSHLDLVRASALGNLIGRKSSRTEVIRRALELLFFAFETRQGDELVVLRKGKEVGRIEWSDKPTV